MPFRPDRPSGAMAALLFSCILALCFCGCSGSDSSPTKPFTPATTPASIAVLSGAGQTAPIRASLGTVPKFIVKDANGAACQNVIVDFAVASGAGTVGASADTTGADGVATPGRWTLGAAPGVNAVTASVRGHAEITAARVEATARLPHWTFMVYMAADNTLAVQGVLDIDEMEAAGFDPDVQTVIEAEFSPTALQQAGCGEPQCFNRPNFNTFRYYITGQGQDVNGPNASAEDIGDRIMSDPAQLTDFVNWAKQNYPAEHHCLVLWNHGGGYTGLIEDQTSAPGRLMSVGDLPGALGAAGNIDVLDFDMCLMGAYETLDKIDGHASYAVFSEEVVPGEGNPYQSILDALQANSSADPKTFAEMIADQFYAYYNGNRASTTVSAYSLAGYNGFKTALDNLATALDGNLNNVAASVTTAATGTQRYTIPEIKDLGDFLEQLHPAVSDEATLAAIEALGAQLTSEFRLRNYYRVGTGQNENDVSRSHGLSVVLPSGSGEDRFADEGPRSLAAYQALYPGTAWTQFLTHWLEGSGQNPTDSVDQGEGTRLELYLVWDENAIDRGVDIDLWVVEPDGNIYIPYIGSVTPNGTFTNDSADDHVSFEGYMTNRFLQVGHYDVYASLYADPTGFRPEYNVAYRVDQSAGFNWLYEQGAIPSLSKDAPWTEDPDGEPTLDEAIQGKYSDLQRAAYFDISSPGRPLRLAPSGGVNELAQNRSAFGPRPTAVQMAKVRELLKDRHERRQLWSLHDRSRRSHGSTETAAIFRDGLRSLPRFVGGWR